MSVTYGSKGASVMGMQTDMRGRLVGLGLDDVVKLDVDGDFGPQTANALAVLFDAERLLSLRAGPPVKEPAWLEVARGELGQKEIKGTEHNARVVEYQQATSLQATDDETPWCASFVSWVLEQAGIDSTRSAWARSYEAWGQPLPPELVAPGAVVVFWRGSRKNEGKGHVGFYIAGAPAGPSVAVLGGNQSDAVTIGTYKTDRVLGYFWPEGELPPPEQGALARSTDAGQAVQEQWA